jgi:homoserine O-acetyltransferase/O-succinyltransferase
MTEHNCFALGGFRLDSGAVLPDTQIAYTTYGELAPGRDNAIVFPTWFTGTHADLEWLIGDGKPLDTREYFMVVPSMFANGLSSSPSNTSPPFDRARFPSVTIQDNVRAQHRLVTEGLGVERVELVLGGSMGAFMAYQWALSYPELVERVMPFCGAARVSRHCHVFLAGAKAALEADPALAGGDYDQPPVIGLRAMARVWAGWGSSQAFYREGLYERFQCATVDEFMRDFWEASFESLDANDLLSQLATWQAADIAATPGYDGRLGAALGRISAKAFVVPAEKDLYFPPEDMAWEAERMPDAELRVIPGVWGHMSLSDSDPGCAEFLTTAISDLLREGKASARGSDP